MEIRRPSVRRPRASARGGLDLVSIAGWWAPRAAGTVPPAAAAVRLLLAYRRQLHHVAIAFAIGVLTGVLAMR